MWLDSAPVVPLSPATEVERVRPSGLALVMAGAGLQLLVGAGAGVLVYALRSRPTRRKPRLARDGLSLGTGGRVAVQTSRGAAHWPCLYPWERQRTG